MTQDGSEVFDRNRPSQRKSAWTMLEYLEHGRDNPLDCRDAISCAREARIVLLVFAAVKGLLLMRVGGTGTEKSKVT